MILTENRTLLLEQQLTVFTNYKNLQAENFTTSRVMRWRLVIEEFALKIQYIKGQENVVVDMLSRLETSENQVEILEVVEEIENVFPLNMQLVETEQQKDEELQS